MDENREQTKVQMKMHDSYKKNKNKNKNSTK